MILLYCHQGKEKKLKEEAKEKMRKGFVLIVFILAVASSFMQLYAAEGIDSLDAGQRQDYMMKMLSIETEDKVKISGISRNLTDSLSLSHASGRSSKEWTPYQGYKEISREQFFRIAGYEDLADEQKHVDGVNRALNISSMIATGIGAAVGFTGLGFLMADNGEIGEIMAVTGLGVLTLIAAPLALIHINNNVSLQFAIGIADSYNAQLLDTY